METSSLIASLRGDIRKLQSLNPYVGFYVKNELQKIFPELENPVSNEPEIKIDSETNLPALPDGQRWRVAIWTQRLYEVWYNDRPELMLYLEETRGVIRRTFGEWLSGKDARENWVILKQRPVYAHRILDRRGRAQLEPGMVSASDIQRAANYIMREVEYRRVEEAQEAERRRKRDAELDRIAGYVGTYPPKRLEN